MNQRVRKQYLLLAGLPIISRTLLAVAACPQIDQIFLVVPKEDIDFCRDQILGPIHQEKKITLVSGGPERQDSVYEGLLAISDKEGLIVIHDGVRPFVLPEAFSACVEAAKESGACILGIPVSETVKQVTAAGTIDKTLNREGLWLAQTPQVFEYELIREAHEIAGRSGYSATDDAWLVERLGYPVKIIVGSQLNIKITTPDDLQIAEAILQRKLFSTPIRR